MHTSDRIGFGGEVTQTQKKLATKFATTCFLSIYCLAGVLAITVATIIVVLVIVVVVVVVADIEADFASATGGKVVLVLL